MSEDTTRRLQSLLEGRFRLGALLREGGTTFRYAAEPASDVSEPSAFLVDLVRPDVTARIGVPRLLEGIRQAAAIDLPGYIPLAELGDRDGLVWLVYEARGTQLRDRLGAGELPQAAAAARMLHHVGVTLDALHARGEVDGHLSPSRVYFDEQGDAWLSPLALARIVSMASDAAGGGHVVGATLAPELLSGAVPTPRSDVFALAAIAYETLTGRAPFPGGVVGRPEPAHELRPGLRPEVDVLFESGLAADPAERPDSAGAFTRTLLQAIEKNDRTLPWKIQPGGKTPSPRVPWFAWAAGALAVLGFTWWILPRDRTPLAPAPVAVADSSTLWLLVADFDGPADEPNRARAFRKLLAAHLDESGTFRVVPDPVVISMLARQGLPDTARITQKVAFQLADRAGIRGVVTGSVQTIGGRIGVIAQAHLAHDGEGDPLVTLVKDVSGENDLIPLSGRMSDELAKRLAKHIGALRPRPAKDLYATKNYEAYDALVAATGARRRGDFEAARRWSAHALELDAGCADAQLELGRAYVGLGLPDSARTAFHGVGDATPEVGWERDAALALLDGDPAKALTCYDRVLANGESPKARDVNLWMSRAETRELLDRPNDALGDYDVAARMSPEGAWPGLDEARLRCAIACGETARAAQLVAALDTTRWQGRLAAAHLALDTDRFADADRWAWKVIEDDAAPERAKARARLALSGSEAAVGQINRAWKSWQAAGASLSWTEEEAVALDARLAYVLATRVGPSRTDVPPPAPAGPTATAFHEASRSGYERALSGKQMNEFELAVRAWLHFPAHAALAQLDARDGDLGRAREHVASIERVLDAPEPGVRAELAALRRRVSPSTAPANRAAL